MPAWCQDRIQGVIEFCIGITNRNQGAVLQVALNQAAPSNCKAAACCCRFKKINLVFKSKVFWCRQGRAVTFEPVIPGGPPLVSFRELQEG